MCKREIGDMNEANVRSGGMNWSTLADMNEANVRSDLSVVVCVCVCVCVCACVRFKLQVPPFASRRLTAH